MIEATRLNGSSIVVNADLIEMVESTPDTLISLTTGRKIMVRESIDEIVQRAVEYRSRVRSIAVPTGGIVDHEPVAADSVTPHHR